MNSLVAAGLFENPLVLATIILVGALANWLMKRRQAGTPASPNENESPLARGQQEPSARQPDLQDILRQLLGGEPPPAVAPPPIPRVSRDEQVSPAEGDEGQFHPDPTWPDQSPESYEALRQPLNQSAQRSRRHNAAASAHATHLEPDDRYENTVRRVVTFDGKAKHPGRAMQTARRRHPITGGRAVRLWRDRQIVRRAFVASLVFAPPKGLDA